MSQFPSLFFTVDIAHAHDLSTVMRSHGVKVYPISGNTPDDEERRFLRLFKDGHIDGLASCGVLQEGFDAPNAMGAFLCRPTKSGLLYRQMVGRVLRPDPAPTGDRYYQRETLEAIGDFLKNGTVSQLVVLPTGTGKTWVAAHVPQVVNQWKNGKPRGRTLFLVHRDNLVTQAADTFRRWTNLSVGVEKGGGFYAGDADVVIASVQCLGANGKTHECEGDVSYEYGPRLKSFRPGDFDTVIVDEAHHAVKGGSYHTVMRYFGVLKGWPNRDPQTLLLCITATPNRSDNLGMEALCDTISYTYPLDQAIKDQFLADIRGYRAETEVDISAVKTSRGDFNVPDLESAINTPERNEIIARKYLEIRDEVQSDCKDGVKPYACVIDFVDIAGRHRLITVPTLFGLREKFDPEGKSVAAQVAEIEELEKANPTLDLRGEANMDAIKTTIHKMDLLKPPEIPAEIRHISRFTWLQEGPESYHLGMMDGTMLSVRQNTLGEYEIYTRNRGIRTLASTAKDLKSAISHADEMVPAADAKVMAADASWRKDPPTEKQAQKLVMTDKKINQEFQGSAAKLFAFAISKFKGGDSTWSRGGVSTRIDAAINARGRN